MSDRQSQIRGFFSSCWTFRNKIVWSWDFGAAALVFAAAGYFPSDADVARLANPLATAAIALGAALVGVVVAGLAVVVAMLDDEFLALMDDDENSRRVPGHMFPYWFVTGTGVATFPARCPAPALVLPALPVARAAHIVRPRGVVARLDGFGCVQPRRIPADARCQPGPVRAWSPGQIGSAHRKPQARDAESCDATGRIGRAGRACRDSGHGTKLARRR